MDNPKWTRALLIAGGTAATAGLLWYLLRDGPDEEEEAGGAGTGLPAGGAGTKFKVIDPKGCSIGIRVAPDTDAPRTNAALFPGEVFEVAQIVDGPDGRQRYLLLADGRGWAFTHSSRDGRLLAREATEQDLAEAKSGVYKMMEEAARMLEKDPALRQEVLNSPEVREMMANPDSIRSAASESSTVADALRATPAVEAALNTDPAGLAEALQQATSAVK
mmetsp:Transcript_36039/g.103637  ORF Transcript_36039/g.103637 Transcript_36039/m.103637 type:complete len:219 (-) Transcript_36039:13-669(-)